MAVRSSRNNTLAGLFVLASIALGVGLVVVLSNIGDRLKPRKEYVVRFTVAEGAEGLDKGAPVKVGGQRVGRVTWTKFVANEVTGEPQFVDVGISIAAELKLYTDANVQLIRPLLGTGSSINIAAFGGTPMAPRDVTGPQVLVPLEPGGTIEGHPGPPAFLTPNDYTRFQNILTRVDAITEAVQPQIQTIVTDARVAVGNVREITDDARAKWGGWSSKADDVVKRVHEASERFTAIADSAKQGVDKVNAGLDDARAIVARAGAAFDEYKPTIDRAVRNVGELTDKANGELYQKVVGIVDRAREGVDSAADAARQADELLIKRSPELEDMIANATLAAQQLKLATVEVRAAPWRLLYQPTKKELENELLYNSVRQYSESVSELRQAAEALKGVTARAAEARAAGREIDQANIDRLSAKLQEAFGQYQEQERRFLQRWAEQGGR